MLVREQAGHAREQPAKLADVRVSWVCCRVVGQSDHLVEDFPFQR